MEQIKNFYLYEMLLRKYKEEFKESILQEFKAKNLSSNARWKIDKFLNKFKEITDDVLIEIIPILVNDGFLLDFEDVDQPNSPLQIAVSLNANIRIIELLIENGSNVNALDDFSCTPFFMCKSPEAAKFLLEHGADIEHRNVQSQDVIEYMSAALIYNTQNGGNLFDPDEVRSAMEFILEFKKEQFRKRVIGELPEAGERVRLGGRPDGRM